MSTKTEIKCEACGATKGKNGKPFTAKTIALHKSMHCKQKPSGSAAACCDSPSYRFLSAQENAMLAANGHNGYTKVCKNCEEVI